MIFLALWKESWSTAIANHLWQSTMVMLAAWLLTLVLRRNHARTRYWVWMAASLKLLLPFSLLTAIGRWLRPASVFPTESPQFANAMVRMADPFLTGMHTQATFTESIPASASVSAPVHHGSPWPEVFIAVWLCGLFFLLLRWMCDWRAIRATLRSATRISLPIDVPVFATSRTIEPGIVGILRPVLLLPEQIVDTLPAPQLRSILAHETCHVRRHDNLTAAMHMAVEAIFWFHPAVWWIERCLIEERERACDEAVLQLGNKAEVYAESILNVCRIYTESRIPCVSGIAGSDLKQRIRRIMEKPAALKLDLPRKLLLGSVAIATLSLPMAFGLMHLTEVHAQSAAASRSASIAATWQGILHADRDLRFVIKITTANDATLRAIFYNLDGRPGGIPALSATLHGSLLKFDLPFASYEGTVNADGNSITGTWTQGQNPVPLNFARATQETAWTIPQAPQPLPSMAADADPSFEVATIKPSSPDEHGPRYDFQGHRFSVIHASLIDLINFAFGLQKSQISNAPDWAVSQSFDISAVPDREGEPSIQQWQSMVKKLLANRFQFKFHDERKELHVYLLTVVKSGPRLKRSDLPGPAGLGGSPGNLGATNATMDDLAGLLAHGFLDRPVVNQTGLTGKFDLKLTWTPDEEQPPRQSADAPPGLFTAIQEQLGLKLVATKAPADVMLIDRVARPSAN